jgi:hypothetical protein
MNIALILVSKLRAVQGMDAGAATLRSIDVQATVSELDLCPAKLTKLSRTQAMPDPFVLRCAAGALFRVDSCHVSAARRYEAISGASCSGRGSWRATTRPLPSRRVITRSGPCTANA